MFQMFVFLYLCWCRLIVCSPGVFSESVSVTEGDTVTLNSDVTDIHEVDDILWKYGAEDSVIADISREDQIFSTYNGTDGRFRDRLKLDDQTGSLTITNITTLHAGDYELQMIGDELLLKTFSVSVYASLPTPNIRRDFSQNLSPSLSHHNCLLLCSAVNVGDVTLSWFKGNSLLSSISVSDLSISLSLPLEVEYQDNNTYSCVLNNTITNHTTHLDIYTLCTDQGLPLFYIVLISAAAGSLFVAAALTCCICKKLRKTADTWNGDRTGKKRKKKSKLDAVYENIPKKR